MLKVGDYPRSFYADGVARASVCSLAYNCSSMAVQPASTSR